MLLKDVIGKPIIALKEGKNLATVKKLLVNRKSKTLEYILLNVNNTNDKLTSFVIPFSDIYGIGDYALIVNNLNMAQKWNEDDINSVFYKSLTEVIGETVINVRGNRIGTVTDLYIDKQHGKIQELGIEDERNNNVVLKISLDNIMTFGYDVIIVNDEKQEFKIKPIHEEHTNLTNNKSVDSKHQVNELEFNQEVKIKEFMNLEHAEEFDNKIDFKLNDDILDDYEFSELGKLDLTHEKNDPEASGIDNNFLKDELEVENQLEILDSPLYEHNFDENDSLAGVDLLNESLEVDSSVDSLVYNQNFLDKVTNFEDNNRGLDEIKNFFKKEHDNNRESLLNTNVEANNSKINMLANEELNNFDEYKNSLIKQFIDRQREVLVGKRVTNDIIGNDGRVLIEKGNTITIDQFNRASADRKDSIVEMAMFSE